MEIASTETLLTYFLESGSVSIDSRSIEEGALFFGIRGDRFNGNAYATKALEKGASWVVVDDPKYFEEENSHFLWVPDSLKALQSLAHAYRQRFEIPILGITGSNGKTTTKELIISVLQTEKRVHATAGNFNNHIGVPLTLLRMPSDTEIAVIEMGANQPGDIQELCEIADPTVGLITNIGAAHLERLGSLDGVQETKGALYRHVAAKGGSVFCNREDARVIVLADGISLAMSYGGMDSQVQLSQIRQRLSGMDLVAYFRDSGEELLIDSTLSGAYNALNIAAALAVGTYFHISLQAMKQGIASYVSTNNRSQIVEKAGYRFWLDAYNANPSSMRAAITHVCQLLNPQELVLVLGDMLEVGEEEVEQHRELGKFISEFAPSLTIGVGPLMQHLVKEVKSPSKWYASTQEASKHFWKDIEGASTIFLKGSRGMKLEELLEE